MFYARIRPLLPFRTNMSTQYNGIVSHLSRNQRIYHSSHHNALDMWVSAFVLSTLSGSRARLFNPWEPVFVELLLHLQFSPKRTSNYSSCWPTIIFHFFDYTKSKRNVCPGEQREANNVASREHRGVHDTRISLVHRS